jgi:hypothetical protein
MAWGWVVRCLSVLWWETIELRWLTVLFLSRLRWLPADNIEEFLESWVDRLPATRCDKCRTIEEPVEEVCAGAGAAGGVETIERRWRQSPSAVSEKNELR